MGDIIRRGRLRISRPREVIDYTSSLDSDERIFEADLLVDYAHVVMLVEKKIICMKDGAKILQGLRQIETSGYKVLKNRKALEDIHAVIESKLIEMFSESVGGRIHTGRSRNDEVATCIRITLRRRILDILEAVNALERSLLQRATEEISTIMPGYTHGRIAQPVTFAHYLLAHFDAFIRDTQRLLEAYERIDRSPLGAVALATTSFPIDRDLTAKLLGFNGLVENSIDAVSARDFILESLSNLSILVTNVSRLAEDLILWSSDEYGMVEVADQYASTSSIMPQKKNPDSLELARSKTGRIYGNLMATLAMMKALPLSYSRDLQELTPRLWDSVDEAESTLRILEGILSSLNIKRDVMMMRVRETYATATELAETLVREKNLPFRTAHMLVGALIREALRMGIKPSQVKAEMLNRISRKLIGSAIGLSNAQIVKALSPQEFIRRREISGGPNPDRLANMVKTRYQTLNKLDKSILDRVRKIQATERALKNHVQSLITSNI